MSDFLAVNGPFVAFLVRDGQLTGNFRAANKPTVAFMVRGDNSSL